MLPQAQLLGHQCARFSAKPNIPHNYSVGNILKNIKGVATQGLILKPDPERGIECYVEAEFPVHGINTKAQNLDCSWLEWYM